MPANFFRVNPIGEYADFLDLFRAWYRRSERGDAALMKFTSVQLTAQPSDDDPRALAPRLCPGGAFHARKVVWSFLVQRVRFLLFI